MSQLQEKGATVNAHWVDLEVVKPIKGNPSLGDGTSVVLGFAPHAVVIEEGKLVDGNGEKKESNLASTYLVLNPVAASELHRQLTAALYPVGDGGDV